MAEFDPRGAVFTPAETSTIGIERIQEMERSKHRAAPLGVGSLRDYFAPLLPGEICAIQAQTSNYKSGFINMWEHTLAHHLAVEGRDDEVIIHVDTENTIDALAIQDIARNSNHSVADLSRGNVRDWRNVFHAAAKIANVQIYRVGGQLGADVGQDLYLSNIYRGIRYMVSGELLGRPIQPAAVFIDYLQALPIDPEVRRSTSGEQQRRLQVREDVYRIREMARVLNCPVIVGVQAKQNLSGHLGPNMLIPGTYDGEETSSIAQRFDRVLGLWMPKTTHTMGETLTHKGLSFEVEDNLLFFKVNKQRGGLPAGKIWKLLIDYKTNRFREVTL